MTLVYIEQHETRLLKPHPDAGLVPTMAPDEYNELVLDIEQRGIVDPLVVTEDNVILDGRHRWQAACAIGLEDVPVRVMTDMHTGSEPEAVDFMIRAAILRRHLTIQQRKQLAEKLIVSDPSKSDRSVAKATGVSRPTVAKIRDDLEAEDQVAEAATSTGGDGRSIRERSPSRAASGA